MDQSISNRITAKTLRVLVITSEWPNPEYPDRVPFIVQEVWHLRADNINVDVFHFQGKQNPINYLRSWIKLRKSHDFKSYDLLHAQFGQSAYIAFPTKVPVVITFRGSDLQGFAGRNNRFTMAGRILKFMSIIASMWAKEVIVVSEHLIKYIPKHVPVHVIPSGIDLELFCPIAQNIARQKLNLPVDIRIVLFASHPSNPIKRYWLAQEAVEILQSRFDDISLIPLNNVAHTEVPLYMNAADALVFTSMHEGSPNVVKEALACNLPVVSVNVGDVSQHVSGVQGCVLCQDDSPENIAQGLEQVLKHRQRTNGRKKIAAIDEKLQVKKIIQVYHSAIGW